jgi:hypothetical protein
MRPNNTQNSEKTQKTRARNLAENLSQTPTEPVSKNGLDVPHVLFGAPSTPSTIPTETNKKRKKNSCAFTKEVRKYKEKTRRINFVQSSPGVSETLFFWTFFFLCCSL